MAKIYTDTLATPATSKTITIDSGQKVSSVLVIDGANQRVMPDISIATVDNREEVTVSLATGYSTDLNIIVTGVEPQNQEA